VTFLHGWRASLPSRPPQSRTQPTDEGSPEQASAQAQKVAGWALAIEDDTAGPGEYYGVRLLLLNTSDQPVYDVTSFLFQRTSADGKTWEYLTDVHRGTLLPGKEPNPLDLPAYKLLRGPLLPPSCLSVWSSVTVRAYDGFGIPSAVSPEAGRHGRFKICDLG
jgi:hypothetical protein